MHLIASIISQIIVRTYRLWEALKSVFEFVWNAFLFVLNLIAWPFKQIWAGLIWLYVNRPWELFAALAVMFAFSSIGNGKDGSPLSASERLVRGILIAIAVIAVAFSALDGFTLEPLYWSGAISFVVAFVAAYKQREKSKPERQS